eukprot:6203665-Pleurochrysis_carterae.AAC.1
MRKTICNNTKYKHTSEPADQAMRLELVSERAATSPSIPPTLIRRHSSRTVFSQSGSSSVSSDSSH